MDNEMMNLALNELKKRHENSDDELDISSINDARILLNYYNNIGPKGAKHKQDLVEYIINPANHVSGNYDQYHNFVMKLFNFGEYHLAKLICAHVLETTPLNSDILGDMIRACGEIGHFDEGSQYLAKAKEIPMEQWSWRLFCYSIIFLKNYLYSNPTREDVYHQALELADEYIQKLPFDEHGYSQKAELLLMMNQREDAIAELHKAIFDIHPDSKDSRSRLVTAQCCVTLLDILDSSNDYDDIIRICNMGLCNTTQEQPSANIGFFVYRKALALDAKAHRDIPMPIP